VFSSGHLCSHYANPLAATADYMGDRDKSRDKSHRAKEISSGDMPQVDNSEKIKKQSIEAATWQASIRKLKQCPCSLIISFPACTSWFQGETPTECASRIEAHPPPGDSRHGAGIERLPSCICVTLKTCFRTPNGAAYNQQHSLRETLSLLLGRVQSDC
jgi:hypothetical protein